MYSSKAYSVKFRSVAQSCLTLCDPMTAACQASLSFTISEFAQTHVHWFGDSIQPSHSLPSLILLPSIFPSISVFSNEKSSIGILAWASVLPMNIQEWFSLQLNGLISLQSKGLSRVFSNTTIKKHQFSGAQLSLWSNSHIQTWLLEKPQLWLDGPFLAK